MMTGIGRMPLKTVLGRVSYQDFLGVAYPPGKISDAPVRLHDRWCELDAEPTQSQL